MAPESLALKGLGSNYELLVLTAESTSRGNYDVKNCDSYDSGASCGGSEVLTPRERELLAGMGNCYGSCHEDFEETVRMVGGARGLTVDQVKRMLEDIRGKYGTDADYQKLRGRLPKDFPL